MLMEKDVASTVIAGLISLTMVLAIWRVVEDPGWTDSQRV
jgi:hypothetical protein